MCLCCSNRTVLASVLCWSIQHSHLKSAVLKLPALHKVLVFTVLGNQHQHIVLCWGTKHSHLKSAVLGYSPFAQQMCCAEVTSTALCAGL